MLDQEAQLLISMVNHVYFKFLKCVMFSLMSEILYLLHPFYVLFISQTYTYFSGSNLVSSSSRKFSLIPQDWLGVPSTASH